MRFGVLGFSYATFPHFQTQLSEKGEFTVNLGDNAQTLAARELLIRCGADPDQIQRVDRDSLTTYAGPEIHLLMNGAFRGPEFPISPHIVPIFLGFSAGEQTIVANADYLRAHQPIGCRDTVTRDYLVAIQIEAFVSGCVTLTMERRLRPDSAEKVLILYGSGLGRLPDGLLDALPTGLTSRVELISHRMAMHEYPLSEAGQDRAEGVEQALLDRYSTEAALVVTPLHHVAAPCLALGVPVVLARANRDARFSFLESLVPIYYPETFGQIDWQPPEVDLTPVRLGFETVLRPLIARPLP